MREVTKQAWSAREPTGTGTSLRGASALAMPGKAFLGRRRGVSYQYSKLPSGKG